MKPAETTNVQQLLKIPLGKKPKLSEKQLKNMSMVLQFVSIPQSKNTIFYNIAQKQTNLGLSSNPRLLMLNIQNKTLSYLSQIPQGYLPYSKFDEITANKPKQTVTINQAQNFKCYPIKGKISTLTIQWINNQKNLRKWNLTLGSSKLMNDWLQLVSSVKDGTYNQQKYEQMNLVNKASPLINTNEINEPTNLKPNQALPTQQNQIKNANLLHHKISPNQQNQSTNEIPVNNSVSPVNKQLTTNTNQPIQQNNPSVINGQKQSIQAHSSNPLTSLISPKPDTQVYSSSNQQNLGSNTNRQSTLRPQMISGQIQVSRRPKIPKMEQSSVKNNNLSVPNNTMNSMVSYNQTNNFISNDSPSILGHSVKVQNYHQNSRASQLPPYSHPNQVNFGSQKFNKQPLQSNPNQFQNSRTLNHQPSQQPVDFVQQLKKKRRKNPQMFALDNQLSQKKLPQYNQKTPSNQRFINKDPSASQFSNQLQNNPASTLNNNRGDDIPEQNFDNDNYQIYKPTNNFPQSTKNLSKIRSDYFQKKSVHIEDINIKENFNHTSHTEKNNGKILKNNHQAEQILNFKNQKYNNNEASFDTVINPTQQKRENSIHNLNKVNTIYLSSNKGKNSLSYNDIWLQTSNPNKKIQIYEQFINRSGDLVKKIVEQISFPTSQRQFRPIDSNEKQNIYKFQIQNLIIKLHFFNQRQSVNGSDDNINVDAPVMYDHTTYEEIKREFYNYNLVLAVTQNQGKIKVPLCCIVQYRGILALVKADIPQSYKQIDPYSYRQQFEALQNLIKVRFLFNTFNCYQSQGYRGGEGKFIVLWNLKNLIPQIPNGSKISRSYFRKQFLLQYDEILEDLQSSSEAHAFTLRHILPEFLAKLQSLEIQILHSKDLAKELHKAGISFFYITDLYKMTVSNYLKKFFMSQIVANIFIEIIRSELNHAFAVLPTQNMSKTNQNNINNTAVVDSAHMLINQFFSYTLRSQNSWKLIVNEASKRYRMIVSKQNVIPGYLLSAITYKLSLQCDFKQKLLLKQKKFFVHQNILPRQVFLAFLPRIRHYDMEAICPTYSKCKQLLDSEQLSVQNYDHLLHILNLKNRSMQLPKYYNSILQQLKTYLANYIPYTLEQQYEYLDVYEFMYQQPVTYYGIKTAYLAIKWLIKANQVEKANQVFQIKFHQLSYWLNEYNTAITEFYDFFSMFYASIGDFQQSICLAKSSMINMTKVLGPEALPVADKHYQLGNIYFKINKKNQALKEYMKTKQILINHQKTNIPQHGIILLKIALLCLNFGELTQCLTNAIQAERIFQINGGDQNQEIQCFQILSRVYEITRKPSDMNNLCEACSKTFNSTQNPKIMERMLKIIMFPKLNELSSQQQNSLLPILIRLQDHKAPSQPSIYLQSFSYLNKLVSKTTNIKKKIYYYLQNIIILADEINRRDLIRKHKSFNEKINGEAELLLVIIEAVGNIVGWSFMIGSLKESWYD